MKVRDKKVLEVEIQQLQSLLVNTKQTLEQLDDEVLDKWDVAAKEARLEDIQEYLDNAEFWFSLSKI